MHWSRPCEDDDQHDTDADGDMDGDNVEEEEDDHVRREHTKGGKYRKKIDSKHLLVQLSTRCYPAQQ